MEGLQCMAPSSQMLIFICLGGGFGDGVRLYSQTTAHGPADRREGRLGLCAGGDVGKPSGAFLFLAVLVSQTTMQWRRPVVSLSLRCVGKVRKHSCLEWSAAGMFFVFCFFSQTAPNIGVTARLVEGRGS